MRSTSLGFVRSQPVPPRRAPPSHLASEEPPFPLRFAGRCMPGRCTRKSAARLAVVLLYAAVTLLDLARGITHTFLYETGIDDISGLATGDALCDDRLSSLMIAYGGANLESFLVRSYILYDYGRYDHGRDYVRASSLASALWVPATWIASAAGDIDVGDAELPGIYAMLIRSVVSLGTLLLTFL